MPMKISFLKAEGYFGIGDYDHAFNFFWECLSEIFRFPVLQKRPVGQAHARQEDGQV